MATSQAHKITLKGSTQLVVEFFEYSIHSILFQRGLYPPEDFKMAKKYGLNMMVSTDDSLQTYLKQVMSQLEAWMMEGKVKRLVLAVLSKATRDVLERWQFDIQVLKETPDGESRPAKSEKEVHTEIQAIIRQITASVTFLPILEEACTFNILVYTDHDAQVPTSWHDADPHYIQKNEEQVRLRSFSTNVHKVEAMVAYRLDQDI
ncbi:DNA-binding protein [Thamnocephalis sphaerospora]|uniref:DNA-binding protein n=1 Tax=Thamnocephalis sphaerospora TaxID=78915 RepID=A0A4P9XTN7_9FUNG|nr:DNA-binding protein [Thamnocephalis sphaerospora]|eukprot:RKP09537.1 DNA-binding protein [Thamnocephalis sphaerospora]